MIQLSFNKETETYVRLMCTRKGVTLENYIVENMEWDDHPDCMKPEVLTKIPKGMCYNCEWGEVCPDMKQEQRP